MANRVSGGQRSLPIALLRAREVVMAPVREMLSGGPVNEQKWRVLRVLEEGGPLDQMGISSRACLLLPSLTRILAAMEEAGLVVRGPDPSDRRRSIVQITDSGRSVLDRHAERSAAIFGEIRARFSPERYELLLDLLEELQRKA